MLSEEDYESKLIILIKLLNPADNKFYTGKWAVKPKATSSLFCHIRYVLSLLDIITFILFYVTYIHSNIDSMITFIYSK